MMKKKNLLKMLLTIVEGGHGKALARWYKKNDIICHFQTKGRGTASSDLMDILGFGSSERDILFSLCDSRKIERLFHLIQEDDETEPETKGLAVTMPLTALSAFAIPALLNPEEYEKNGGEKMETNPQEAHSLILIVVNQGHTDDVMNTARTVGARGGTIIRARFTDAHDQETFYGISLQAEKELIMIVAGKELRKLIMETVNKKHGVDTKAGAMLWSVAIDQMQRLG
jgi:hypothetical protein